MLFVNLNFYGPLFGKKTNFRFFLVCFFFWILGFLEKQHPGPVAKAPEAYRLDQAPTKSWAAKKKRKKEKEKGDCSPTREFQIDFPLYKATLGRLPRHSFPSAALAKITPIASSPYSITLFVCRLLSHRFLVLIEGDY